MSLKERLMEDMKTAMKAREAGKARLSVIQLVRAAILQVEKDKQIQIDDSGVLDVLAREVKQRNDALVEYEKFPNTAEVIERLRGEVAILREYLPAEMSRDEITGVVREAIAATGALGPRDMGKVMGYVLPKTRGRADGKVVNQIVRELLPQ